MIKTALKHWIYEICINQVFDGLAKNFSLNNNKRFNIKIGQYINSIHVRFTTRYNIMPKGASVKDTNNNDIPIVEQWYFNCEVRDILKDRFLISHMRREYLLENGIKLEDAYKRECISYIYWRELIDCD